MAPDPLTLPSCPRCGASNQQHRKTGGQPEAAPIERLNDHGPTAARYLCGACDTVFAGTQDEYAVNARRRRERIEQTQETLAEPDRF